MPLHTDYRPTTLDSVVGNQETVQGLKVHLGKKSPNRCILLTGPAGCGKTTIGYCIAREVGSLEEGDNNWNFSYLNASNFRGIDMVREIDEAARRTPLGGARNRTWMFDESHMLTKEAKEASLALLENPPKRCWIIFATSDPGKLFSGLKDPNAMRRRFTEFQVSPVSDRDLGQLLLRVTKRERKRVPDDVVQQIVRDSLGSPGMALNVLDKIIDLPEEQMAASARRWAERESNVITLCRTLLAALRKKGGWKDTLAVLKDLQEEDPETIRRQVLEYFLKVALDGNEAAYLVGSAFEMADCYRNGRWALYSACYQAFNGE